jgi:hypothetical protein
MGTLTLEGRRVEDELDPADYRPGDFGRSGGSWWVCLPTGQLGMLDDGWKIEEHANGKLTVDPSIHDPGGWHGYLRAGVWVAA